MERTRKRKGSGGKEEEERRGKEIKRHGTERKRYRGNCGGVWNKKRRMRREGKRER